MKKPKKMRDISLMFTVVLFILLMYLAYISNYWNPNGTVQRKIQEENQEQLE